jgi:hypothetical protein
MSGDDGGRRLEYVVRGSHRMLAPPLDMSREPTEVGLSSAHGMVVVPVARPEPVVETAVEICRSLGWPLVLLCSHGNTSRRVFGRITQDWPDLEIIAADLLHDRPLRAHRDWCTWQHWATRQRVAIDTNRKRNLGLAAARMTGRAWVLFVDDDVLHLSSGHVAHALTHLCERHDRHVASWPSRDFPDNSVVHHARRDVLGLEQDVFMSGAALLTRVESWEPPGFPPIYNEDWLFLFEPLARREVVRGPDVGQRHFDPFEDPMRARHEEVGDVLAEGLFHLLHVGAPVDVARHGRYWRSVHAKRTKLLLRITAELRRGLALVATEVEHTRLTRRLTAIDESRRQLMRATPESLADFVRCWRHDEQLWREYLAGLPQRETLKEALVYLGLHEAWIVTSERERASRR